MSSSNPERLLRLRSIIAPGGPIPVSRSTWWHGVRCGRFPKPVRFLGPRITAWRQSDIERLIAQGPDCGTGAPTPGAVESRRDR
jgi:prophage regulatory protein